MMSESGGRQIRSYHRAFHFELMLYTVGNLRPWRPVPARGVLYTALSELAMIAVAHAPAIGGLMSGLGPIAVYGLIPLSLGWLLTVAKIEGRRFHVAMRVGARHVFGGRTVIGGYREMKRPGTKWRPGRVVLVNDGRDGAPPSGLRVLGPGRVLLRYPCKARLDGPRLTVAHTSERPCDPGQALRIADGASVRFIDAIGGRQSDGESQAGSDPDCVGIDETERRRVTVPAAEAVMGGGGSRAGGSGEATGDGDGERE
jgi:hypothetical protein